MSTKLLIVDDSPTVLSLLSMGLGQKGYKVFTAENGADALKIIQKFPLDLVLTDLNMPGMDGLTLASKIRQDEKRTGLPIIMLSTESEQNDFELARKAGVNLYLTKPIGIDELDGALKSVLTQANGLNKN